MQTRFRIDGGRSSSRTSTCRAIGASTTVTGVGRSSGTGRRCSTTSSHASTFRSRRAIFFQRLNFTVGRPWGFPRHLSFLQAAGTGRAEGHVHAVPRPGVNAWRFPNVQGCAPLDPQRVPRHRRDDRTLRRPRQVRLSDGAARPAGPSGASRHGTRNTPTSILTRLTDFLELQRHPARRPRQRPQPARMAAREVEPEAWQGEVIASMPPAPGADRPAS